MLEKLNINDFKKIYHLMETSFPTDEYRTYEEQRALLDNRLYSIYVLYGEKGSIKSHLVF